MPPVETWSPGVYVGVQAGYGMTNWDDVGYGLVDRDDSDAFAGRVYLGYDFHKNFAIEVGYGYFFNNPSITVNGGTYIYNGNTYTIPGGEYDVFGNTYAIDLMGVIKANIVDDFGLYAKVGVDYLHTEDGSGYFSGDDVHNFNVAYGAGAYYDFTKNFSMDVSWLRYNGSQDWNDDYQPFTDMFMLGVKWKFII